MKDKPLIIGIDPGKTTAVAAINLEGETELLESRLEFPHDEVIETIIGSGYPLIITTDKENIPSTVDKIASSLGSKRFIPENDLSRDRKRELGKGDNSHEKDAYAAALHAYKRMRKQIRKINRRNEREDREKLNIAKDHILDMQ